MDCGGKRQFFRTQLGWGIGHDRVTPLYFDLSICEMLGKSYEEWMKLDSSEREMWRMFVRVRAKKDEDRQISERNRREMEEYNKAGVKR